MRDTMPAMRRFRERFNARGGFVQYPGTSLPTAAELVRRVEAEGNALIGAVECHAPVHGREHDDGTITPLLGPCLTCGAAL
jgi:deoxycytidylate deaminase